MLATEPARSPSVFEITVAFLRRRPIGAAFFYCSQASSSVVPPGLGSLCLCPPLRYRSILRLLFAIATNSFQVHIFMLNFPRISPFPYTSPQNLEGQELCCIFACTAACLLREALRGLEISAFVQSYSRRSPEPVEKRIELQYWRCSPHPQCRAARHLRYCFSTRHWHCLPAKVRRIGTASA